MAAATRGGTSIGTTVPTLGTTWASRFTISAAIPASMSMRSYMRVRTTRYRERAVD